MENQQSQLQKIPSKESKILNLKMPNGEGSFGLMQVDENSLAHKNRDFFTAFGHMLLTTRKSGNWNTVYESGLFQEILKRNEVTCIELYNAFWKAYGDQYTPASGIEWRNL